ncbi:hypothetical protein NPIL_503441 [Nephila pilipes]|uniref:Uncharacterized protein n=1 Tax=Nephila pilipes TaxID=299642 RepID=A0A8X6TQ14_NEPPI|nr:hypothetical protein NPIL_503441 [Nephila pilipes]
MKIEEDAFHQFISYQISLFCDDSIEYPRASCSVTHDNSYVSPSVLDTTYNDGPYIRRPAKHLTRDLYSSENDTFSRVVGNPWVIGQSSSHETADMSDQQNFSKMTSAFVCLPSSSGASASSGNIVRNRLQNGDAPIKHCPPLTKSNIKQTVSNTVSSSRN